MKSIRISVLVALLALLNLTNVSAQDRPNRGNFNPEQFRERMMERVREQLDVKEDAEWKVISERVNKVMEARREVGMGGGMGAAFGRRRGPDGGEQNAQGGGQNGGRRGGGPGGFFGGEPSPEGEALQKALDSKASADEIKAKLAKYREARQAKRANLEKAQEDLKKVLTSRQEASAVMLGLLE